MGFSLHSDGSDSMTQPDAPRESSNSSRRQRWFAVALTGLLLILFLFMISGLLLGVIAGILLWTVTTGFHKKILKAMRGRRAAAAGISVVITLLVFVIPIALLVMLMAADAASLAQQAQEWYAPHKSEVEARIEGFTHGGSFYILDYRITAADVMSKLEQASGQIGTFLISLVQNAAGGVARAMLLLFVSLYTLFFFYLDGAAFLDWLKRMLPMNPAQSNRLLSDFFSMCKASLKTLAIIGFIQGSLGGLAFWVCGIPAPFFWTMLMAVASIIPAVGAQIILV
ncbi:AI-2E family transporter, partial [candidate division KSB1 bacterium]